jgi:PEP-CTERM motif
MRKQLLASALVVLAGTSHAALDWTSDTLVTFSGYDGQPLAATGPLNAGWLNSEITAFGPGFLTVTLIGKEATYTDQMSFNLGAFTLTNTAAAGTSVSLPVGGAGGQTLDFTFKDTVTGNTVANGGPSGGYATYAVLGVAVPAGQVSPCGLPDLCEAFDATINGSPKSFDLILGFNDGYKGDADYDDMVVGLSFTAVPVPEPQSLALILSGLGVMGLVARRRRSNA